MTTSSWYQTWHPPASLAPVQNHFIETPSISNYSVGHNVLYHQRNQINQPDNFLPYLLALTMIKPDPRHQYRDVHYGEKLLPPMERTGPFRTWYQWSVLDFVYPSEIEHDEAIAFEDFIPKNNLPLGLEVYKDRIFVTMPKWKPGVPVTLAVLPRIPQERSPALVPYPDWSWHKAERVEIIELFFKNNECGNRVAELFNQRHPEKHAFGKIVRELVAKFREAGWYTITDKLFYSVLLLNSFK